VNNWGQFLHYTIQKVEAYLLSLIPLQKIQEFTNYYFTDILAYHSKPLFLTSRWKWLNNWVEKERQQKLLSSKKSNLFLVQINWLSNLLLKKYISNWASSIKRKFEYGKTIYVKTFFLFRVTQPSRHLLNVEMCFGLGWERSGRAKAYKLLSRQFVRIYNLSSHHSHLKNNSTCQI